MTERFEIIRLSDRPELAEELLECYRKNPDMTEEDYAASIRDTVMLRMKLPQWYAVLDGERIEACVGVAVLTEGASEREPSLCVMYAGRAFRECGMMVKLLEYIRSDMNKAGISALRLRLTAYN